MPTTRRLAAILAADVAGYSRLMGADEEGTHERLNSHFRELVNPKIAEHRGRIVKNTGDGLLAEFASVVDAVRCSADIQRGMVDREPELPEVRRIRFRIGINHGDVIVEQNDIFGDGVNVAVRLEGLADPGGICVSARVQEDAAGKLDLPFEDIGEQQLKNIARPVRVYRIAITPAFDAGGASRPLTLPDKPSVAVLPFQNMTGDVTQDYFVDGIVEEITTSMSRLPWLFVIARNSSFTYQGRAVDVRQVARELGVRYVLEGSVRKASDRVRIVGQLIDTTTGAHIWADRFDGALDDIFELQDQVASNVVAAIEPRLRISEIKRANRKPPQSLDAYDLYLRALGQFHTHSLVGTLSAVNLLKQALAIDPTYAPAAALIGECYVTRRNYPEAPPLSDAEILECVHLARQAVQWDRDDPDTLWMAAITLANFAGEHTTGAYLIERALTLNPNSAHAWNARGYIAYRRNQLETAMESFERAIRLSPLDPLGGYFSGGVAIVYVALGRYHEALEWADRTLHEFPNYPGAMRSKLIAFVQLGRMVEARDELKRLIARDPRLTISKWRATAGQYVPPNVIAVAVDSFRKAGMPEE